jgi:hypothetical protein
MKRDTFPKLNGLSGRYQTVRWCRMQIAIVGIILFLFATAKAAGGIGKVDTAWTRRKLQAESAGGTLVPTSNTFTTGDGYPMAGPGDGMTNSPEGVARDASGYLYAADTGNHRILNFESASGAFIGWIGKVDSPSSGGSPGCNGAPSVTSTPGWCSGGTAVNGSGDGMVDAPTGVAVDG